jgi:hypothetical protein
MAVQYPNNKMEFLLGTKAVYSFIVSVDLEAQNIEDS